MFIALGSNIGDRVQNLTAAVKALEDEGMRLIKSGRWYESEAMYVEDQARFLNTVIEVCHCQPIRLFPLPRHNVSDFRRVATD